MTIELITVDGIPVITPDSVLPDLLSQHIDELLDGDIICICSKIVSKAEDRFVDLSTVEPGTEAARLAGEIEKDPRLVELILQESHSISRKRPGVLIVRNKLGIVSANAAIDLSNSVPTGASDQSGPWALLLPKNPDKSARDLQQKLQGRFGVELAVVITDSLGRPFRVGTVGAAIGVAGIPAVWDQRGSPDLNGRLMEFTISAFADQVAAASDLVAGQGAEGTPVVVVRGLEWPTLDKNRDNNAKDLIRDPEMDLYL